MEKPKIYSCKCMSFSGRFPLTSGEIGGFLLFQCSTCLIYHLFVVLTSQVVNSNANASPLHCSNYYIIFGFLFLDRGSSTEGEVFPFSGFLLFLPLCIFSHLSFYVPSLQHEKVFLAIYLFNSFLLLRCHPLSALCFILLYYPSFQLENLS